MNIHKVLLEELSSLIKDEYDALVKSAVSYANTNDTSDRVQFMSHKHCHNKLKHFKEFYSKKLEEEITEASNRILEKNKANEQERLAKEIADGINEKRKNNALSAKKTEAPKMTSTSEGPISPIVDKVPEKKAPAKRGRPKKKK